MQEIHDNSFPLPDLNSMKFIKTVVSDGLVQAVGLVRITAEGILITDQKLSLQQRAIASGLAIDELKKECMRAGLQDCHVFVEKSNVKEFLKFFGFQPCKGQALVIHF